MRTKLATALAFVACLSYSSSARAAVIVLDFEGVGDLTSIGSFYNGVGGPDYDIVFSANSLALVDSDAGGSGNTANEPSPQTTLVFLSDTNAGMNVLNGFTTGFSFFFAAPFFPGIVNVYDGLNGTGNVLASLNLATNTNGCGGDPFGDYNCWTALGVPFAGTAFSVGFGGTANFIVFDDITLGSDQAGTTGTTGTTGSAPEPTSLVLFGSAMAALGIRRMRQKKA